MSNTKIKRPSVKYIRLFLFFIFVGAYSLLLFLESFLGLKKVDNFSHFFPKDFIFEDSWYEVFFQGILIGYSHFRGGIQGIKEGGGYILENRTNLKLPLLGKVENIDTSMRIFFTDNYRVKNATFSLESPNYFFKGYLERINPNRFYMKITTPSQKIEKIVTFKERIIGSLVTPFYVGYVPLKRKMVFSIYDPFMERKIRITLTRKGKRDISGEEYIFDFWVDSVKGTLVVDKKGTLLEEKFLGFKFVKKDPLEIFKGESFLKNKDIEIFSIPSNVILPKNVSYMKVRVFAPHLENIRGDFNQKVYKDNGSYILEIYTKKPQKILNLPFKLKGGEFKKYLEETLYIKPYHPQIVKIAKEITKGETNSLDILKKLLFWIDKNIEKTPTISFPNPLDTLKMKQGDCGELSALLVSFLRSLGIPSYVNIGIVYAKGRFFYHAWPSVYVGTWIDTDPALSQLFADATHIKFFQGLDKQFDILKLINSIKIDILSYR